VGIAENIFKVRGQGHDRNNQPAVAEAYISTEWVEAHLFHVPCYNFTYAYDDTEVQRPVINLKVKTFTNPISNPNPITLSLYILRSSHRI